MHVADMSNVLSQPQIKLHLSMHQVFDIDKESSLISTKRAELFSRKYTRQQDCPVSVHNARLAHARLLCDLISSPLCCEVTFSCISPSVTEA